MVVGVHTDTLELLAALMATAEKCKFYTNTLGI